MERARAHGLMEDRDLPALADSVNVCFKDGPCRAATTSAGELGMFATRDIAAGERVVVERPLALTVCPNARPFTCASCFADSRSKIPPSAHGLPPRWPRRCAGCGVLRFCSEKCEAALAPRHGGYECAALAAIACEEKAAQRPVVEPDAENLLAQAIRILADRHLGTRIRALDELVVSFEAFRARLISVPRSWPPAALVAQTVDAALRFVPADAHIPPAELADVLYRQQANVYGVCSRGGRDIGRACCVGAMHLFNHSCVPSLVFDSVLLDVACADTTGERDTATPSVSLVSLVDIPAGVELTTSYTGVEDEREERRAHLSEYYGFECACPRCSGDEALGDAHAAMRCALADCGSGYSVAVPGRPDQEGPDQEGDEQPRRRCVHCGRLTLR